MSAGTRTFDSTVPMFLNEGMNGRCFVLSMSLYSVSVTAGRNTMTVKKLKMMPFTRLMPRSAPIWNCMNASAAEPNSVVTALAAMVDSDLRMAAAMACSTFGVRWRSAANACSRKMA